MLLYRIVRKLRLHRCFFRIARSLFSFLVAVDDQAVQKAVVRLERLHPDKGQSCLCRNIVDSEPAYDLQIIVPAYNAALYIAECLESVLNQHTRCRYVVTVVNDGSTDDTPNILQRYASHPNVVIINQENRGFSGARNAALSHIQGRYITFVDADDRLPQGAVEALMEAAVRSGSDIVEGGYCRFRGDKVVYTFRHQTEQTADWSALYGYPVGKVYRASLFADVHFPEHYWFEDTICSYILYPRCVKVATIDNVVYDYRINENGISYTSQGDIRTLDALWVTRRILADSLQCGIPFSNKLYETFLVDVRVNYTRFVSLCDEALHRDVFVVTVGLMRQYFSQCHTDDPSLRHLEHALRSGDYGAYRFYGRCFLCV
ncbi:MAG: glycosyltransferase family 2 protein [Bacteroidaceae bacterium]|nr:glycosyltransferase family 2 protein [Bacteroidaceae bacterium]